MPTYAEFIIGVQILNFLTNRSNLIRYNTVSATTDPIRAAYSEKSDMEESKYGRYTESIKPSVSYSNEKHEEHYNGARISIATN
jgi:hypothetical protein